jgi:hypothetical protein
VEQFLELRRACAIREFNGARHEPWGKEVVSDHILWYTRDRHGSLLEAMLIMVEQNPAMTP